MGAKRVVVSTSESTSRRSRKALTPEDREQQLIAAAYDLAEERILNGTATSQEIVHFLKLGTQKSRTELEILERQKELITAKTEALQSAKRIEELYTNAMNAMRLYSGESSNEETEDSDL